MTSDSHKIFVTGGAGFIGTNLVYEALEQGNPVCNLDLLTYAGNRANLKQAEKNPNYQFIQGSIGDAKLLQKIYKEFQPDGVLNLAAESHVDRSIDGPAQFIETNLVGTFQMLEAARSYFAELTKPKKDRF